MKDNKKEIIIGLKKARTSLDKIIGMIENDVYCIDSIQQSLAVIWLLKSANQKILEDHLHSCFKSAATTKDIARLDEMTEELLKIIKIVQNK